MQDNNKLITASRVFNIINPINNKVNRIDNTLNHEVVKSIKIKGDVTSPWTPDIYGEVQLDLSRFLVKPILEG
jgi:hypothetical protein